MNDLKNSTNSGDIETTAYEESAVSSVGAGVGGGLSEIKKNIVAMLSLRNAVFFPGRIYQIDISTERDILAVQYSVDNKTPLFVATQKENASEPLLPDDCHSIGVIAEITDRINIQGGSVRVVVKTEARAVKLDTISTDGFGKVAVQVLQDRHCDGYDANVAAENLKRKNVAVKGFEKYVTLMNQRVASLTGKLAKLQDAGLVADIIADNLPIGLEAKQSVLNAIVVEERLEILLMSLYGEIEIAETQRDIEEKLHKKLNKNQKEYFLREQIKVIQTELGDDTELETEVMEMKKKLASLKLPKAINVKLEREIDRYSRMNASSAESAVIRSYVSLILDLPWKKTTKDNEDIVKAESILEGDHYGLEKVKERILEYLAVRQLNKKMKGQIICLVGPPGVGKTSIGKSIAKALGRNYTRMSLGGVRDEAEIRGHRRTYIGAIPGRIISCIKDAGTRNPLILLDEIDKLAGDFRGDPAGALLEVLDSEQNKDFTDHYLEIPFDLSDVIFIATANTLSTIPRPLLDRMEVIEISGYTEDEKLNIAAKYLVPKKLAEHGLSASTCTISDTAIKEIIRGYTRESGVRNLERKIADICRKAAVRIVKEDIRSVKVAERSVSKYLGKKKYRFDIVAGEDQVGVVTGLAWTSVGGETLSIEVNILDGGSGKLKITGQVGDVMKESAEAALSFVRTISKDYKIDEKLYTSKDVHIHIPEGAIPKDGPSAGITMATAIVSAFSGIKVSRFVAMTGEVTLRGRVLPIGGLKEKALAALRAGIKTVLYPIENQSDFEELPEELRTAMEFVPVKNMKQVLKLALVK